MNKYVFIVMSNNRKYTLFIKSTNENNARNKLIKNYKNIDEIIESLPYVKYKKRNNIEREKLRPSKYYSYSFITQSYLSNVNILK